MDASTDAPQPDAAAPAEQPQESAEAFYEQGQDAGTAAGEGEPGDDAGEPVDGEPGEGGEPVEAEPLPAPSSWSKDAKDVFSKLPREAQEIIAKRETERDLFLQTKSREAANTRQTVENEARQALTTIMRNHEQALSQFLPQVPEMPDPRLLQNPETQAVYFQQKAEYDYASAQRDHIAQQIEQARQHAGAIAQQQYEAELQAEHQVLEQQIGVEWSEPSARAKLLADLQPIAAELGYSQEVMAQARATDILALRQIGSWKADATKYRELMKRRMEPVRAAKTLPPAARPGTAGGQPAAQDTASLLYPDDIRR